MLFIKSGYTVFMVKNALRRQFNVMMIYTIKLMGCHMILVHTVAIVDPYHVQKGSLILGHVTETSSKWLSVGILVSFYSQVSITHDDREVRL